MTHPFGDLLSQHLHRKHGLSQAKLAEGILQDPSIIGKMCKGQRLNGPQARERVVAIIGWLRAQAALGTVTEANALLTAAGMSSLRESEAEERLLLQPLRPQPLTGAGGVGKTRLDGLTPSAYPPFLRGHSVEALPRTPVVAREEELAHLDRLLHQALAAKGRVAFVMGDAGSGKTALIGEFARRALRQESSLVVAMGNCSAYGGLGDAYLPFREILALLTGDVEAQWRAGALDREAATRLWALLPHSAQTLLRVGPKLLDIFLASAALKERATLAAGGNAPWLAHLEARLSQREQPPPQKGLDQSALFESYTRVLLALAQERPLLLVLEDLHWADHSSIGLLFHLGRRLAGQRILVVGSYRPQEVAVGRVASQTETPERHPLQTLIHEFQRLFGDSPVDLEQAQGREFVDSFLDMEANRLAGTFREDLYRLTRGHPLFTTEMVRALQNRGGLARDGAGYWVERGAIDWAQLPTRVEGVIGERIERLPSDLREVIKAAAVLGEEFVAEALARLLGRNPQEVVRLLGSVLERQHQLVQSYGAARVGGQRLSHYRFRHILFQHYLYSALNEAERVYWHEGAGKALEKLYRGHTEAVAAQLARHFREAGETAKTIHYWQQAGVEAMRRHAYQQAVQLFDDALSLLQTLPEGDERTELSLTMALAEAYWKNSQIAGSLDTFQRAADLARRLGLPEALAQAALGYESVRYRFNLPAQPAVYLLREAQGLLGEEESHLLVRVLGNLAQALRFTDELDQLEALSEEAIGMARRLNDPAALFGVLYPSVLAFRKPEKIRSRMAALDEMMQLAQRTGDREGEMSIYNSRVIEHLEFGDIRSVDADLDASMLLAEKLQQAFYVAVILTQKAMRALLAGRFADAEGLAQQAMAVSQQMEFQNADGAFGVQMFTIRREQGQLRQLAPLVRHFVEQNPESAVWRPGLALIYSDLGWEPEARAQFEALAVNDFAAIPRDALWVGSLAYLAEVCAFLNDTSRAATLYRLLLPYAEHALMIGFAVVCYGAVARYLGLLAATMARWTEAEEHYKAALQMNARMEALPWLAHTQAQYAAMLLARGRREERGQAFALLDEALATATALGMNFLAEKIAAYKRSSD